MRASARLAAAAIGAIAVAVPAGALAAPTLDAPQPAGGGSAETRTAALDAAAAWRDTLDAFRAPRLPTPTDTESVILVLGDAPAARAAPAGRAAAAEEISARQRALEPVLASLGATITFRYRVLVDAVAVRLPAGRLEALAALPEVRAVVPVTFLAPAQATGATAAPAPESAPAAPAVAGAGPAHIALIDAGIDPSHPWLGGGMGPTFPIIGGADLVDGDGDPRADGADPALEAHGTQMASLVLRSEALQGLPPAAVPRLLAYRVVAPEAVGGRVRPLARSDRVLAALEDAVDPDGNGDTSDAAAVILLGLSSGLAAAGTDPVADAAAEAERVGSTVVAPAGNDGPTFSRPGSVGGAAGRPTVIAVGGASADRTARTADLDARLGPAAARLGPLPLLGPDPLPGDLPVVVLRDDAGVSRGGTDASFRAADGTSLVAGALAVVARGGAPIAETAARAAAAGAYALALWDEDGVASYPAIPGDSGLPLPVVGLGAEQGAALARLAASEQGLRVTVSPNSVGPAAEGVASFSSSGPTVDGRPKPDLVAPAVGRETAWPGRSADGTAQTAALTGTSAAAAEVAAIATRLRIDRPALGPAGVRSLLLQAARPIPGVPVGRQGAGLAQEPTEGALRVEPGIVATSTGPEGVTAAVSLRDLGGGEGRYSVSLRTGATERVVDPRVLVRTGRDTPLRLRLPRGGNGELIVRDGDGTQVARATVVPSRPATTPSEALGTPEVTVGTRYAEVRVRLGALRRASARIANVSLHGVAMELVPAAGGDPLPVAGAKQSGAWAPGTYRFLVARRLASGLQPPAGEYRLRVRAEGPDGTGLVSTSAPFTLR